MNHERGGGDSLGTSLSLDASPGSFQNPGKGPEVTRSDRQGDQEEREGDMDRFPGLTLDICLMSLIYLHGHKDLIRSVVAQQSRVKGRSRPVDKIYDRSALNSFCVSHGLYMTDVSSAFEKSISIAFNSSSFLT
ncbi:hypothetical protein DUI87_21657 [Hirundo rustica rustica]|uniref:Uncharacterized protein n=1 Tax=Hirundo rustica rustica TaxID=333673 RepID=A0A3M0JRC5_HIRRU|nr:hypothetical protein DUI87_21657 [Hirundo rustica rustica]